MNKKKPDIVCGGYSSEYDISIESGKNVHDNIDRNLWEVYLIVLNKKSWNASDDFGNEYIARNYNCICITIIDGNKVSPSTE